MNAPNQLSFLPEDYLENKAQRRANVICAILFLVTMVSIGFAFTTSEKSLKEVEQRHARVDQQFTEAAKRIDLVQKMQEKQRTMAHQAELTASLLERVPRSLILAKITNALPQGCSLTDFALTSSAKKTAAPKTAAKPTFQSRPAEKGSVVPEVAQAKTYDVFMKVTGLAPTDTQVGELIRNLRNVAIFRDVNLVISDWEKTNDKKEDKDAPQYRKFTIEMMLDPTADVKDTTETASLETGK